MRETFKAINALLLWTIAVVGPCWLFLEGIQGWTGLPKDLFSWEHWQFDHETLVDACSLLIAGAFCCANLVILWSRSRVAQIIMGIISLAVMGLYVARLAIVCFTGNQTFSLGAFKVAELGGPAIAAMGGAVVFLLISGLALLCKEKPVQAGASEGPVSYQRIDSLDLLRGIAILGIFLMNTWTMTLPQEAYTNPATYSKDFVPYKGFPVEGKVAGAGGEAYTDTRAPTGAEYYTFLGIHLFADMKFVTMFSMMFGAGILLQGERAAARGLSPWRIHYGRMTVLLAIGLIHAFGIWYGDILTTYAMLGMILFPLRKLGTAWLIGFGVLLIASTTFLSLATSLDWHIHPIDKMEDLNHRIWVRAHLDPSLEQTETIDESNILGQEAELTIYGKGSSWMTELRHRAWESFRALTVSFPEADGTRCAGCILIGMALMRLQFFRGKWSRGAYAALAALLIPVGWMITWLGVVFMNDIGWRSYPDPLHPSKLMTVWGLGVEFNYWGSLITEMGYISFGVLLAFWAAEPARQVLRICLVPVRSIGRMALSCYILESLIGTTVSYGRGFGLFGRLWRYELLIEVGCVWVFLMIFATVWMHFFRQGPLEWVWHRIVYWRGEPPPLKDPAITAAAVTTA